MTTTTGFPYLAALKGERPERRPIWIMRQAGRYLPEYREVRAKTSFIGLCKTPELACEVTLQPIRRFGFDAAILFSDILVPLEPMGAPFRFDDGGPQMEKEIRTEEQVKALRVVDSREHLGYVADAVRMIKGELGGKTPLIGFAGAPLTLASYMIEGGGSKDFLHLKSMLYARPDLLRALLDKLADQILDYMLMQVEAGADALQLFDTWGGILHPQDYTEMVLPGIRKIMTGLKDAGVPRVYFLKGSAPFLQHVKTVDADAFGLDWTMDLADAAATLGKPVQGNLDPIALFGTKEEIRRRALEICRRGDTAAGHVFNLGHGILPPTPIENVETLVETVQGYRKGD
ncbi:MAG TPA: uroporphyrinogen decarboxylase [Candidatus Krumholzibacteria bacterium]|nr:uroporphyrinogen decarboxylase [Candidatus Krumholzibacteria bacterium]HRX50986.1 uroporphyrinogen decarboxylase [Candidatus Krumholzibacteria bacterium]